MLQQRLETLFTNITLNYDGKNAFLNMFKFALIETFTATGNWIFINPDHDLLISNEQLRNKLVGKDR